MSPARPDGAASGGPALRAGDIRAHLTTRWLARELEVLAETDSTNRVATERAAEGAPHGATVVADAQNAGRGRHGRSFHSPAGVNLYTSTLLRSPDGPPPATWVLGAGLALADCVAEELAAPERVAIKWPNDVQIDGLKTAGILMEAVLGSGPPAAVLGIGVNLNLPREALPEAFRARATTVPPPVGARSIARASRHVSTVPSKPCSTSTPGKASTPSASGWRPASRSRARRYG